MQIAWQKDGEILEDDKKETEAILLLMLLMHISSIEVLKHFVIWYSLKIFMKILSFYYRKLFMKTWYSAIFFIWFLRHFVPKYILGDIWNNLARKDLI